MARRPFGISIDGQVVGALAIYQTAELQVEPGRHALHLSAGRRHSLECSFDATDEEVIGFSCHGARVWPTCVASLVRPDLGISLKSLLATNA